MTYFNDTLKLVDDSITELPSERDMFTRGQVVDLLLDLRNDIVQLEAYSIIQHMLKTGLRFRDMP